jgi:hypothetical protein
VDIYNWIKSPHKTTTIRGHIHVTLVEKGFSYYLGSNTTGYKQLCKIGSDNTNFPLTVPGKTITYHSDNSDDWCAIIILIIK